MTIHEAAFTSAELDILKLELGIGIEAIPSDPLVHRVTSIGKLKGSALFPPSWVPGERTEGNNDICVIFQGPRNSWHGVQLTEISRRTIASHDAAVKAAGSTYKKTPGIIPIRTRASQHVWVFHRNTGTGTISLCAPTVSFDLTEEQWSNTDSLSAYLDAVFGPARAATEPPPPSEPVKRKKTSYVGAPAIFTLEYACQQINQAYAYCDLAHIYMVGSALERPDWRDVDLRMIMSDADFQREFPDAHGEGGWEMDPKWILLTASISGYLTKLTGLPIDFQFQPQTHANARHKGRRNAMGMNLIPKSKEAEEV